MASKLHRSGILTGCVDCFCLVCESHVRSEEEAANHIEKPVHLKNLAAYPYFDKYAVDHVRKVKKGYYCEFCNLLLTTAPKVGLHVTDTTHIDNKGSQLIKRAGSNIIVFDDILITEQAWSGLIDDMCAVCNIEFSNVKLHVANQKHILNLIQMRVEFGKETTIYRKIDNTTGHCLICNAIFALHTLPDHYKNDVHKQHVDEGKTRYQSFLDSPNSQKVKNKDATETQECDATSDVKGISDAKVKNPPDANVKKGTCETVNVSPDIKKQDALGAKAKTTKKSVETEAKVNKTSKETQAEVKNTPKEIKPKSPKKKITKTPEKGPDPELAAHEKFIKTALESAMRITFPTKKSESDNDPCECKIKLKETKGQSKKDMIFEHVTEFQKNGININFETETAFCKKCFESVDLDIEAIKEHIDEHNTSPKKNSRDLIFSNQTVNKNHSKTDLNEKSDSVQQPPPKVLDKNHNLALKEITKDTEVEIIKIDLTKKTQDEEETEDICTNTDNAVAKYVPGAAKTQPEAPKAAPEIKINENNLEAFANQNSLTYNKGNNNAYCRMCNSRVPAAIKNMKEHVSGMSHKTKVARAAELAKAKSVIPKKPMAKFITWRSTVMNVFGVDDVILNDKFCLTRMSYSMITTHKRLRCQACEVTLDEDDVGPHLDGPWHERAMERTPVVTNLDNEFVREVRPGLFHCGFCNLMMGPWEDVGKHLKCSEHAASRRSAASRLGQHLPGILEQRAARANVYNNPFPQIWGMFH